MLNKFVVVDLETSGLEPDKDGIIEVAAIKFADNKIVGEFSALIKYNGELSQGTLEKTGLKLEDLKDGMDETTGLSMLKTFIGDWTIVAHNALFELKFLESHYQRLFGESITNNFIDTLTICRNRYTYPHKLEDMCEMFDIWPDVKHRALSDCYFCGRLLMALEKEKPIGEWLNKLGYMKKYGAPEWAPTYAQLFPQEIQYGFERKKYID